MRQIKHYQTIEFERVQKLFTEFRKTANSIPSVLDFGCGKGKFLNLFSSLGFEVTGTDINSTYVEEAKLNGFNVISIVNYLKKISYTILFF